MSVEKVARAIWEQRRRYSAERGVDLDEWGDGSIPRDCGVFAEARVAIEALGPPMIIALANAFTDAAE